jgi:hypothetical protein
MNASAEERIALARRGIELHDAGDLALHNDIESAFAVTGQREGLVD